MRCLVGCEYSGAVREQLRKLGHEAYSCDIIASEDNSPYHIIGDIFDVINRYPPHWFDLIILHPPCTKIALCGNSTYGRGMTKHQERIESLAWTADLWRLAVSRCTRVALENPKNVLGSAIGKRTQAIHPYQFGHMEQKETWLWLHGLPPLVGTDNVYEEMMKLPRKVRERMHFMSPGANRGHERSRTYAGIAKAFAEQWSTS